MRAMRLILQPLWKKWNIDGKETIFGNEIIQLKTNKIPKGLVALEGVFDGPDRSNAKQTSTHKEDLEEVNLETKNAP